MSYAIRNSIALGIMLLLVLGVGTYIRAFNMPKRAKAIEKEIQKIDEELQNTPNLIAQFNELSATLTDTQKRWETRNKEIPPIDVTAQSYAYFSHLIDLSGPVKLDMIYAGMQTRGNYGFNVYNLRGEAPFENLYRFLWYLENDRKLYKIRSINFKGVEVPGSEKEPAHVVVTFDMTVNAYFSSVAELSNSMGPRSLTPNYLNVDPFTPVISSGVPPNNDDLVEIERSALKGVIPGKAFIEDQHNRIQTLEEGDEVYLGYVTKIDPEGGRLECTLNKGGIIERFELKIRYGPQTEVKK